MSRLPEDRAKWRRPTDHGLARLVLLDGDDERPVQFHKGGSQLQDVPQAGESGSGVVHGQLHRTQGGEGRAKRRVVGNLGMLGHLEHDRAPRVSAGAPAARPGP